MKTFILGTLLVLAIFQWSVHGMTANWLDKNIMLVGMSDAFRLHPQVVIVPPKSPLNSLLVMPNVPWYVRFYAWEKKVI